MTTKTLIEMENEFFYALMYFFLCLYFAFCYLSYIIKDALLQHRSKALKKCIQAIKTWKRKIANIYEELKSICIPYCVSVFESILLISFIIN